MKPLTLLTLASSASAALPNVTPIPVYWPGQCTNWPSWINTGPGGPDLTGSIMFVPSNTGDSTIDNLPLQSETLTLGDHASRAILGAQFVASRAWAKSYFRCFNGVAHIGSSAGANLTISRDRWNAHVRLAAPEAETYVPDIYYLQNSDGTRLDGMYLGALNQTKWEFRYHDGACGADGRAGWPWLEARLTGLPESGMEVDPVAAGPTWEGFLKVVVY